MRKYLCKLAGWGILPLFAASLYAEPQAEFQAELQDGEIAYHTLANNQETQCAPPLPYPQTVPWVTSTSWCDFLYLQALEDNLEPAALQESYISTGFYGTNARTYINPNSDFKPAFQAGTGINLTHRELDLWVDYFRYASTNQTVSTGNNSYYPMLLQPALFLAFLNGINVAGGGFGSAAVSSFNEVWYLRMNFIDLMTGFIMQAGKVVEWHPYAGLRGGWINQHLSAHYTGTFVNAGGVAGLANASLKTNSWAIGPRIGLDVNLEMGEGFSFYGTGAGDLLYTSYNYKGFTYAIVPANAVFTGVNWTDIPTQSNIGTIRTHMELELGFRWSKYFNCQSQLLDLSAGYGFQVFFSQNMFRHHTTAFEEIGTTGLPTTVLTGILGTAISTTAEGNLYLHGFRLEAKVSY